RDLRGPCQQERGAHDREPEQQRLDAVRKVRLGPADPQGGHCDRQRSEEREADPDVGIRAGGSGRGRHRWWRQANRPGSIASTMDWALLVFSLLVILAGAELFTNGVEWVGEGFGLSEGAVGSVLAAVGTALPETLLPIIAIVSGHSAGQDIGVGAILGAPFMLTTLAMVVVAVAVFIFG